MTAVDRTNQEAPPVLATALSLVDTAIRSLTSTPGVPAIAPLAEAASSDDGRVVYADAWEIVRKAALDSVTAPAAPAKPTTLEAEARGALERYAGVIAGLEPSIDSAVGIGVAAVGALVHLATLGVVALDRIGDEARDVSSHLRAIARTLSSANIEGWGGR